MKILKDFFDFNRSEVNASLILSAICCLIGLWPYLQADEPEVPTDFSNFIQAALEASDTLGPSAFLSAEKRSVSSAQNFHFNPNTATEAELIALGFKKYLAIRLLKYRNAGGRYQVKSDLYRLYGVDSSTILRLWNYIDLPEKRAYPAYKQTQAEKIPNSGMKFELNSADTTQLIALPGIGSKLAQRIIAYRNLLGGFYKIEQLQEVYGLKPEVIARIQDKMTVDLALIVQLDINLAEKKTLAAHPYIRYQSAEVIINYRTQHGLYRDLESLKKAKVLTEEQLDKLKYYLKF